MSDNARASVRALTDVFRNPALRRLESAFAGSVVGDWAYAVAVSVYAYDQGGPAAVGLLAVVRYVLMAVVTPFTATLADRLPRRAVMIAADLVRAALVVIAAGVIFSDGPALLVYGLAIVTSLAGTPFRPAQAALLPKLARDSGELTAANVASSTIESVGFFAGPALGGLLLAVADIPVVYLFNAATFVWSAALVFRIRPVVEPTPEEDTADEPDDAPSVGFLRDSAAGFATILRSPDLRALVGLYAAQCVVAGASAVFIVAVALDMLDLGKAGVGYLDATLGIGGLVGGFVALVLAQRGRLAFDFALGVFLWAGPLLLIAAWPTLPSAIIALVLIGLANSLVDINVYTILQRVVPDDVMGRVFGALESSLIGAMALGALVMPILIATVGLRAGLLVIGAAVSAVALLALPRLLSIDRTTLAPAGIDLLLGIPMLAPLPERIIERLARSLVTVELKAGEVAVHEGDEGDRFYIVESGTLAVSKDGVHVAEIGPGNSFGEIALLRDVPRTATVTASSAVVLRALDRRHFIPAVTGHGDAHEAAELVISSRMGMR
ncbi:MFS transporter [Gaiella sp.]|uniref:MFS transporter n=1 Tax=Gaiella sp. TaxID=2663207 RepID=UPI00326626D2